MSTLPEEVKRRIVVELAGFRTTLEVAVILQLEYDFEIRPDDLCRYDATKDYFAGGAALAELFHATRRAFVQETADIPIANRGYRLRRLQQLTEAAERKGNYKLAAALIEQAAKEVGGHHTNVGQATEPAAPQMSPAEARKVIQCLERWQAAAAVEQTAAPEAPGSKEASLPDQARGKGEAERRPEAAPAQTPATSAPGRKPSEARKLIQAYVDGEVERRPAAAPLNGQTGAHRG